MSLETPAREWLSQAAQQEGDVATAKRLVGAVEPTTEDLVDSARLLLRYDNSRHETNEIRTRLLRAIQFWGMTVDELNARCRAIWQSGYRPPGAEVNPNGSGFDSADPDADRPAVVRSSLHRRSKSQRSNAYPCTYSNVVVDVIPSANVIASVGRMGLIMRAAVSINATKIVISSTKSARTGSIPGEWGSLLIAI